MSTKLSAPAARAGALPPGVFSLGQYPAVGPVHQNVPLQNLIVGYGDFGFIADQVFPVLPVMNESDDYYEFKKSPWFRREESLIPDRATSREVNFEYELKQYRAQRYGYQVSISARERANSDSQLRLEQTKLTLVKRLLMMDTEIRVAEMLSKANTSGVTLSGTDQFDNASFTSTPSVIEKRFDVAKEAVRIATGGFEPNVAIVPAAVAKVIKRDSAIRDLIKYTQNALVNGDLPDTLWGMRVYVPGSVFTTTPEGTAEGSVTYTDVWGNDIRLMYVAPPGTADFMTPSVGYQMRLSDDNYAVSQWSQWAGRSQIDFYECSVTHTAKLTMPSACYVIENAIA